MMPDQSSNLDVNDENKGKQKRRLIAREVEMIEEALVEVGDYGEVRLMVEKGKIRFLVIMKSIDALRWQPGNFTGNSR